VRCQAGSWNRTFLAEVGEVEKYAIWGIGTYENQYVRENGAWKIETPGVNRILGEIHEFAVHDPAFCARLRGWPSSSPSRCCGDYSNPYYAESSGGASYSEPIVTMPISSELRA
jgi:hypothetical protein